MTRDERSSRLTGLAWRAAVVLTAIGLPGCATILTGTSDELTFAANVPGVRLSIDGKDSGQLPLTVEVSRSFIGSQTFKAKFEAPGYETQEFRLERLFNGVALLDITSPVTSGGIDVLTGSLMKFSPVDYHVQMLAKGQSVQSTQFQRSAALYRFALTNFQGLRTDLARGGGEYLTAFTSLLGNGDRDAARRIEATSVRHGLYLVGAADPEVLVQRVNHMLADSPALDAYRL